MKHPPDRDGSRLPRSRSPGYVVQAWVSEQLKEKIRT
jgi:hypothetical protein